MDVGADIIDMVKTNTKILCKDTIYNLIPDWPGGYYLMLNGNYMVPGQNHLIYIGYKYKYFEVVSFITIEDTCITKSGILFFYISTLNILIMFIFSLFLTPLKCLGSLGLLMRLNKKNPDSLIYPWKSTGLISVVGYGNIR